MDPARLYEYCCKPESRDPFGTGEHSANGPSSGVASSWEQALQFFNSGGSYVESRERFPKLYATHDSGLRRLYELSLERGERLRRAALGADDEVPLQDDGGVEPVDQTVRGRERRLLPGGLERLDDDVDGRRRIKRCVIFWGPPGTGKSSSVNKLIGRRSHFRMANGKWFDGYAYERILWMDDFHPGQVNRAMLLQLMESGHFRAEVKGGMTMIHIDELYITSNWDPQEWFPEENKDMMRERGQAVIRRAEVFHVFKDGGLEITPVGNTITTGVPQSVTKRIADYFKKERERDREPDHPKMDLDLHPPSSPPWLDPDDL